LLDKERNPEQNLRDLPPRMGLRYWPITENSTVSAYVLGSLLQTHFQNMPGALAM
jgi:hypothetical protein